MIRLAYQGVYCSIQGEGALLGEPMVFVRLAGCSVGCPQCDTQYRFYRHASESEIVRSCEAYRHAARWAWITGGEPTDQEITPLIQALRDAGWQVAVATSGIREAPRCDWLSVSPHSPGKPVQWYGHEVKIVGGLNGLDLATCDPRDYLSYPYRYVVPCAGQRDQLERCRQWVYRNPGWRLGLQAHKEWSVA